MSRPLQNGLLRPILKMCQALGCKKADVHPRVTENMDIIIDFISALVEKDFAYESAGDVYFRTRRV